MTRPARAADAVAIAALETSLFAADAWSLAAVEAELSGPGRLVLVDGDPVAAYVVTLTVGDVVDLQRIAVHPAQRRRGLARTLLCEAVAATDADRMLLEVSAANEAALGFYAGEGFVEIARRRSYYRDGSDAVVMQRELPPPSERMEP